MPRGRGRRISQSRGGPGLHDGHHPQKFRGLTVMQRGFTLWMTGLPCSGKSTICDLLLEEFRRQGLKVELLDGDVIRTNLSKGLSFSREDRDVNIRRVGFVCDLLSRNDVIAIAACI